MSTALSSIKLNNFIAFMLKNGFEIFFEILILVIACGYFPVSFSIVPLKGRLIQIIN